MRKNYYKLVRDKVPCIIAEQGRKPKYRQLNRPEYEQALKQKVIEEAIELLRAETLQDMAEEAADLMEVLSCLERHLDIDLVEVAYKKRKTNGSFLCGYFLESVEIPDDIEQ